MKKILLAATVALALAAGNTQASEEQWAYSGERGPEYWSGVDPAFEICAEGMNQSPVNLTDFTEAELAPLAFDYTGLVTKIRHNASIIQADYAAGSTITVNGRIFELQHIDFHTPSEHLINGEHLPMEAQFVHTDADGNLAVIAVLYRQGEENRGIRKLWHQLPAEPGMQEGLASQVRADTLLIPENKDYYQVNGSLTTPPCSEGVLWLIMKDSLTVSEDQVKQLADIQGGSNNRPVQNINARSILQ